MNASSTFVIHEFHPHNLKIRTRWFPIDRINKKTEGKLDHSTIKFIDQALTWLGILCESKADSPGSSLGHVRHFQLLEQNIFNTFKKFFQLLPVYVIKVVRSRKLDLRQK